MGGSAVGASPAAAPAISSVRYANGAAAVAASAHDGRPAREAGSGGEAAAAPNTEPADAGAAAAAPNVAAVAGLAAAPAPLPPAASAASDVDAGLALNADSDANDGVVALAAPGVALNAAAAGGTDPAAGNEGLVPAPPA